MISLEQLQRIMPNAKAKAALFYPHLIAAMKEFGIVSKLQVAAFLSQLAHESGEFRYVRELASGEAYNGRKDLGNTSAAAIQIAQAHGSTPGPFWKGHGLIQITGYNNHVAAMMALGIDCVEYPELLCTPEGACRSAGHWWKDNNCNRWADQGNNQAISGIVNTGSPTRSPDKINGLADRMRYYVTCKSVLGLSR